jgi:hypothetical protein
MLTPYKGRNDLISLLKAGSFHRDFETLDLSIEELRSVFTSTPLDAKDNKMRLEKGNPFRLPAISPQPLAEESQKVSMPQSYDLVDTDISFSAWMVFGKIDSTISLPEARPLSICKTLARSTFPIRWPLAIWIICSRLTYSGNFDNRRFYTTEQAWKASRFLLPKPECISSCRVSPESCETESLQ